MAYILEVPLDNGDIMLVDVTGQVQGVVPASRTRDVIGRLPEAFSEGLERVQSFAGEVLDRMRHSAEPPDVVAVEFGLKLTAKVGVIIAESSGDAHLKVTAEWHRDGASRRTRREDDDGDSRQSDDRGGSGATDRGDADGGDADRGDG